MEIAGIPVRDVIIGVCVLVAIYLVVTLLRLLRLRRHKPDAETFVPARPPVLEDIEEIDRPQEDDVAEDTLIYSRPVVSSPAEPPSFDAELGRSQMERELRQLRAEVATLRNELAELKAASRVSPQYADAMALVQRGLTAQDVADRCGISLAEAELVWALARGPQETEQEDEYGGASGRNPARPAG